MQLGFFLAVILTTQLAFTTERDVSERISILVEDYFYQTPQGQEDIKKELRDIRENSISEKIKKEIEAAFDAIPDENAEFKGFKPQKRRFIAQKTSLMCAWQGLFADGHRQNVSKYQDRRH